MKQPHLDFTLVVPLGPRHTHHLPRLLKNLASGDALPRQVIIAPTSTDHHVKRASSSTLDVVVLGAQAGASAAANRNRGWEAACTTFVSFCDADDWYAPWRLRVLDRVLRSTDAQVAYHACRVLAHPTLIRETSAPYPIAAPSQMAELNAGRSPSLTRTRFGGNNPIFPASRQPQLGHATVRRTLDLRFPDIHHGEDGFFALQALSMGADVAYVDAVLSIYEPLRPSTVGRFVFGRMRHFGALLAGSSKR